MAIYKSQARRPISKITEEEKLSNQVIFSGNSGNVLSVPNGVVFIELLQVAGSGTVEFKDGNGDTISTGITDFSQDHSAVRCDRGITIVGSVGFAKGYVIEDVFQ